MAFTNQPPVSSAVRFRFDGKHVGRPWEPGSRQWHDQRGVGERAAVSPQVLSRDDAPVTRGY